MDFQEKLQKSNLLVILTSSPAGLGHLRVTDALQEGLPQGVQNFVLSSSDPNITYLHRLSSINPILRQIQYLVQYHPLIEQLFTNLYRSQQRGHTKEISNQLISLLNIHHSTPKKVLIITTHFGLAHKIAQVKDRVEKKTKIKLLLYVIVTDDTFQKVWAVDGADYLVVPSKTIKKKYLKYFLRKRLKPPKLIINPYPISPKFIPKIEKTFLERKKQFSIKSSAPTQLLIPISGAAVQLKFFQKIIPTLCHCSKPFQITVVLKVAPYTHRFQRLLPHLKHLTLATSNTDRGTVDLYQEAFFKSPPPALEITKPSEQAFKVLLEPNQVGGVILLFTNPIGKQEEDNLKFLSRHQLIPNPEEMKFLHQALTQKKADLPQELLEKAQTWRALRLPQHSRQSVLFIENARATGLFSQMLKYQRPPKKKSLSCYGVEKLWEKVAENL